MNICKVGVRSANARAIRRSSPALRRHNALAARFHRWIGLGIGLFLALSGLTGSYLAFYPEIETISIEPLQRSAGRYPEHYEAVYQAFIKAGPPTRGRWTIELPPEGGVITGRFNEGATPNRIVSIEPVALEVVRDVRWGRTVSSWIYELHYSLWMGELGALIMGVLCLLAQIMVFAGLTLWWRSSRTIRGRFSVQQGGNQERKLYDFHRLAGIIAAPLLLISLTTAAALTFPDQLRSILSVFSPVEALPDPKSSDAQGRSRLPLDEALAAARRALPQGQVRWVKMPKSEADPYLMRIWQRGEPSARFPKSYVWLDQYDGRVLAVRNGPAGAASNRLLDWLYPLHSGQAFGTAGRAAVALLGLVPASLFITGWIRWRRKSARLARAARHHLSRSPN